MNEMQGLEQERQIAVEWLKKERKCQKLTVYSYFLVLNTEIKKFNEMMTTISELREAMKSKK